MAEKTDVDRLVSKFVQACADEAAYSPDIHLLQFKYTHLPVFVYGWEKLGFQKQGVIGNAKLLGRGWTRPHYSLWRHHRFDEPVMFYHTSNPIKDKVSLGSVFGEVYLVPLKTLWELDSWNENNVWKKRTERQVVYYPKPEFEQGKTELFMTSAYMYLGTDMLYDKPEHASNLGLIPSRVSSAYDQQNGYYYEWTMLMDNQSRATRDKLRKQGAM